MLPQIDYFPLILKYSTSDKFQFLISKIIEWIILHKEGGKNPLRPCIFALIEPLDFLCESR